MTEKQVAHFPQETEFYVLPAHISASHIRIPYSKIMVCSSAAGVCTTTRSSLPASGDYRRSDPMKYINWKASASSAAMEMAVSFNASRHGAADAGAVDQDSDLLGQRGIRC